MHRSSSRLPLWSFPITLLNFTHSTFHLGSKQVYNKIPTHYSSTQSLYTLLIHTIPLHTTHPHNPSTHHSSTQSLYTPLIHTQLDSFILSHPMEQGSEDWLGDDNSPLEGFPWRGGADRDTTGILLWSEPFLIKVPNTSDTVSACSSLISILLHLPPFISILLLYVPIMNAWCVAWSMEGLVTSKGE